MIRAVDFDPHISYSDATLGQSPVSGWKQPIQEIDSYGSALFHTGMAVHVIRQIDHLKGLEPLAIGLETVLAPMSRIVQIANLSLSSEKYMMGEHSIRDSAEVSYDWVSFVGWIAQFERLAVSTQIITLLSSLGLSISFALSMMDLIATLGESSSDYTKLTKHSYKVSVSLLAIYLFMTSIALSTSLTVLIAGGNFAVSFI